MNRKTKRVYFTAFFGIALAASALLVFCFKAGSWLSVTNPLPAHLDVVFTFGGENVRIAYSRGLMERFRGARWVLSDYYHQYSRILSRDGFDMSRVTVLDTCPYTLSEVKALAGWLKDTKCLLVRAAMTHDSTGTRVRIGLVSSPCHMRRIRYMVSDVIRDTAFICYCLPVPLERYGWTAADLRHWWHSKALRSWVISETGKLLWYWLFSAG